MPRVIPTPELDVVVSLLVTEQVARQIERMVLKPSGMRLSAPHDWPEHGDGTPSYIIETPPDPFTLPPSRPV